MSAPFFSVAIATRNRAAMLRAALRSLVAQSFGDFECFVVDDGSTDKTPKVFDEFRGHPRLHFARFEDNRGYPRARNYALEHATGRFLTFLDDDDLWLPDRLERFALAAQRQPGGGFWFSNAYLWRRGRVIGTLFDPARPIPVGRVPGWYAVGDAFLPYVTTNLSLDRAAVRSVGPWREDLKVFSDTELFARLLAAGHRVGAIPELLAVRRLHESQITHDYAVDFSEMLLALEVGGAPPEVLAQAEKALSLEMASYSLKGLQPENVQQFLRHHMTDRGLGYWKILLLGLVPKPLLRAAKALRAWYLRAFWIGVRYGPWPAPRGSREVRDFMEALEAEGLAEQRLARLEQAVARRRLSRFGRLLRHPLDTLAHSFQFRLSALRFKRTGACIERPARTVFGDAMTVALPSGQGDVWLYGALVDYDAEVRLTRFLLRALAPGQTFFDVGAALGYYSLLASRLVGPSGQVHAFEPSPAALSLLRRNVAGRPIRLVDMALSDAPGRVDFFVSPFFGTSSMRGDWEPRGAAKVEARATTLDAYCAAAGVRPDCIKLDVEGVEDRVLQGAAQTLSRGAPTVVLEVFAPLLDVDRRAIALLQGHGYRPYAIDERGALASLEAEALEPYLQELKARYARLGTEAPDFDNLIFQKS